MNDIWRVIHLLFIFRNYNGEYQTETKIHQGTSFTRKQ